MFFDSFRNRPIKSILSIVLVVLGLYTLVFYQELQVENLSSFLEFTTDSSSDMSLLLLTWGLNLACAFGYILLALAWFKDVFFHNYHDEDQTNSKIICLFMGIVFIIGSWLFISFIFTKLVGIIVAMVIVAIFVYGDSNNSGDGRRRANYR